MLGVEYRAAVAEVQGRHGCTPPSPIGGVSGDTQHPSALRSRAGQGARSSQDGWLPRAGRKRERSDAGPFMARSTIHVSPPSAVTRAGASHQQARGEIRRQRRRTPSRQSFGTTRRSTLRCSHFGSPLRPGRPVLTLGVSRRRRISGLCSCRRLTERGAWFKTTTSIPSTRAFAQYDGACTPAVPASCLRPPGISRSLRAAFRQCRTAPVTSQREPCARNVRVANLASIHAV